MINHIHIKNFKALREVDINLSNINVFTGLNGMGKSTALQVLMLLRENESFITEIKLNGDYVKVGTLKDAFCEFASEDDIIKFQLTFSKENSISIESKYDVKNQDDSVMTIHKFSMNVGKANFFNKDNFIYLSADRISPEDGYKTDKTLIGRRQLGNHGELAPHYYQVHKNDIIPIKELAFDIDDNIFSLEYQLNKWLGVISPGIQVHTRILQSLVTLQYSYKTKLGKTSEYKAKNAGFGLTYVFSVLVAILSSRKGDILIIENPESHIHPKGQSELARLLALAAKNGVQVFIETHSDHIIYGLRIAIKEQDISKDEVKVYYFDRDEDEHFSNAFHIEIDEHGRMKRDVRKYFREYEYHLDRLMS